MRLGLVTYNLAKDWDIPAIIQRAERTGFEAAELRTTHVHGVEPNLPAEQRELVDLRPRGRRLLHLAALRAERVFCRDLPAAAPALLHRGSQTVKDSPHPHSLFTCGLTNLKPFCWNDST